MHLLTLLGLIKTGARQITQQLAQFPEFVRAHYLLSEVAPELWVAESFLSGKANE
jgi:hypothetical protein